MAVKGDTLYFSDRQTVYAVTVGQGRLRWSITLDQSASSPVLAGPDMIVVTSYRHVTAVDASTGETRWSADVPPWLFAGDDKIAPVAGISHVIAAGGRGVLELRLSDGALVSAAIVSNKMGALAIDADKILVGDASDIVALIPRPW